MPARVLIPAANRPRCYGFRLDSLLTAAAALATRLHFPTYIFDIFTECRYQVLKSRLRPEKPDSMAGYRQWSGNRGARSAREHVIEWPDIWIRGELASRVISQTLMTDARHAILQQPVQKSTRVLGFVDPRVRLPHTAFALCPESFVNLGIIKSEAIPHHNHWINRNGH